MRHRLAHAAGALLMLGVLAPVGQSVAAADPAQGMFLVASRELAHTGFARSVILLIQHDSNGTLGLIVNQPTDIQPTELLSDVPANFGGRLYIGGPVASYGIIILLKANEPPPGAEHVFDDVYASGNRDLLGDLNAEPAGWHQIRLYAGHAGWSPGQLDREIARDSWHVVGADAALVFADDPERVWQELAPASKPIMVNSGEPELQIVAR
jgi:putative transcriptional regulator